MLLCCCSTRDRVRKDGTLWGIQAGQQGCRQDNLNVTGLECGRDFTPTSFGSTENVCDQMGPVDFVVIVHFNVNMHVGDYQSFGSRKQV